MITIGTLLASAVTGVGVGIGGIVGILRDWFDNDESDHCFTESLKNGHILITTKAGMSNQKRMESIFQQHNAYDISEREIARERAAA
ncbi:MAG: hypothetical protein COT71_03535 [Candidatus Andersenbacteria bacterium CG10_big_fil_rev_8_21_14_0_10_54_11]|uniref:Uncharacterized protein n=1 Tax=Candidatus Andersenbacteria bacterium CG10_big_fil_rev_8_21_14_0_10_54_11 TaxID=1974485 RepID=A0A2M6WYM8_9BACT|nr:MAG: hypothetical protein COT71_03535 [Candidatus Andersenbacteria bacterium CG10_big_fil_rev_8_21_14_0_10_54_11]